MKSDEQQKLKKYKILYWSKKFTDEYLTTTYLKSLLNNLRANNLFEEVSNIFQNEKVYQHINIYIYIIQYIAMINITNKSLYHIKYHATYSTKRGQNISIKFLEMKWKRKT